METDDKIEVVNAPEEIWLNFGDLSDVVTGTVEYSELYASGEISWCYHEVDVTDVRYVRADLHTALMKDLQKDQQTLLKLMAKDREEIERLKALLVDAAGYLADLGRDEVASYYRDAGGVTK